MQTGKDCSGSVYANPIAGRPDKARIEWAYMLRGRARVTGADPDLRTYQNDLSEGAGVEPPPPTLWPVTAWVSCVWCCHSRCSPG